MKDKERKLARALRSDGWSLRTIAAKIKCSKSSVSKWISDVQLTDEQIEKLKSNQDKGRAKAAKHPNGSRLRWERFRQQITDSAKKEIPNKHSLKKLKLVGAALYWAEGYKASRNVFLFANSDASMIKLMMLFLRNVCKIRSSAFRGRVNIHPHLDIKEAQRYWSKISSIPIKQFHKPSLAVSKASKQKRQTLPYGTFNIVISDVVLCSKIKGWIEGMKLWASGAIG